MRTDRSRARVLAYALGMLAGCGGGGAAPEPEGADTAGGEEPITCSVPNAPAMDDYVAGVRLLQASDASGLVALVRACDADNACACSVAGASLASGEPVPRDVDRGLALLERGCQGADPWGCYWLAMTLFENRPADVAHVTELLATACEDEIPAACDAYGRMRMSGIGGDEDPAAAVRLYESACEDGHIYACFYLGQAAAEGLGMDAPDPARARELLAWSCEQAQLPAACTALASIDTERRDALLRGACDAGDAVACVTLEPPPAGDGTAGEALELPTSDAGAREIRPNEWSMAGSTIGGDVALSTLGLPRTCIGFVSRRPTRLYRVPANVDALSFTAKSDGDSVIAVRDAAGRWSCGDDLAGGAYHARVTLAAPAAGLVAVWAGTLRSGEVEGELDFTSEGVEPLDPAFATPAGPQPVTIPAASRAHHYQLRVVNATGVAGTLRLDGHDLWGFGPDEGQTTSDEGVQCALGAGAHTLEITVASRTRTAHREAGGPLVEVELHGLATAGAAPSDETRLFRVQWSPSEAPASRTTTFRLSRTQAADRAQCAAAPASGG